jgi:hypothetical protein
VIERLGGFGVSYSRLPTGRSRRAASVAGKWNDSAAGALAGVDGRGETDVGAGVGRGLTAGVGAVDGVVVGSAD